MEGKLLCIMLLLYGSASAQDWRKVGNCGAGLNCGPRCQRLCLSQHNYYRSLHGSAPLKCDPLLAKSAQSWANSLALYKTIQRSKPSNDYVENVSWKKWGWKGMETKLGAIPGAVRSWYSEIKRNYDYNEGQGNGIVTHFKNVIHAREARLGCGIVIKPGDGAYVVAHYSLERGKQFQLSDYSPYEDITPRKEPDPKCRLKSFERKTCWNQEGPFVTPDKCLKAGCCYDDMFMDEPGLQWHNPNASIWCFKTKDSMASEPPSEIKPQNDPVYGSDTSWQNVGTCGQGLTCGPDCQLLCLKLHNYYRALHKSTPLRCDPELAKAAQKWTDQQAADGKMYHSKGTNSTESISWKGWGWEGMDKMEGAVPGAVRSWYSEIKNNYDYETGTGTGVIGHFKAVVWNGEQRLGCGLNFKRGDGTYVTAHYAPPSHSANKVKTAPLNIKPRKEPEPACAIESATRIDCFGDNPTEEQKVPFVTPELCIQNGCCYDDMYMDEPETHFYKPPGRTWCFKKKPGAPGAQPTQQPPTTPTTVSPSGPTQPPGRQPSSSATAAPVTPTGGQTPGSQAPSTDNCFANSCYTFAETGKKWTENQVTCKGQKGDLVSMETEGEWEFINSKIQQITFPPSKPNEWHIGLKKEGDWKWVSGKPLTIEKWQRGQPSGDGDFTVMSKDYPPGSKGLFNDLPDWIQRGYICEIPKGETNQPEVQPPMPAPTMNPSGQPGSPVAPSGTSVLSAGSSTAPVGTTVGPTEAGATTPVSGQQEGMTEFEKDCLNAHNEYRARHGVPPLKWNQQLKQDAQAWANTLAQRDTYEGNLHAPDRGGAGENIAWFTFSSPKPKQCQGPKQPDCTQCREMVKDWYDEIENYNFDTGKSNGGVILHFTQVVWKATTDLGMATAMSDDIFFTVARYKPQGNILPPDNFVKNIPKVL